MAGSDLHRTISELRRGVTAGLDHFSSQEDTQTAAGYVTGVVLPLLQETLRAFADGTLDRHRVDPSQNTFIHYTSRHAVVSILEGKLLERPGASLRLYDTEHANDPTEGTYLARALDLPGHLRWAAEPAPSHAYVTSFVTPSEERDLRDHLPFWEAYGDRGRGCALEILVPSANLSSVLYGVSGARAIRSDVTEILEVVMPIVTLAEQTAATRDALWEALAGIRYLYKQDGFDHEMECRIVIPLEEADENFIHFDYQPQTGSLRRYYEQSYLDPTKLFTSGSSITVGPAVDHRNDFLYSLCLMQRRLGLGGLRIRSSAIDYRPT